MAVTPNLGLPLLDGNMTADVPRDQNTLAAAIDAAMGNMSTVPTVAKDAAGAITELHQEIQNINPTPADGSVTPAKLSFDPATQAELDAHTANNANPHAVTKAQVGLANVDDIKQMPIAGGTATGIVTAQNNTSYTTKQVRNITLSTLDPSGGSNGDVWIKYTP